MLPNILTTVRLVIIPFFAYFMLNSENFLIPLLLFVLSGVTDIVDGWIARRFNMITDVGSVYDPLVDKLMQITAVVCLSVNGTIPGWVICVVAFREFSMIAVGVVLYLKKIVVHSNWYGKAATVFFYAVMLVFIMFPAIDETIKTVLLAALVVVMIAAAIGYLVKISGADRASIYKKKA